LVCASLAFPAEVRVVTHVAVRSIPIKGHALVSALSGLSPAHKRRQLRPAESLLVGYSDGIIHLHDLKGHLLRVFPLLVSNFAYFYSIAAHHLLVFCEDRQYQLLQEEEETKLEEIELSNCRAVVTMATYIDKFQQLVFVEEGLSQTFRQCDLPTGHYSNCRYRQIAIFEREPRVLVHEGSVILATSRSIEMVDIKSRRSQQHSHILEDVRAMEFIEGGILLAGTYSSGSDHKQILLLFSC
jgi:hypothetical protein